MNHSSSPFIAGLMAAVALGALPAIGQEAAPAPAPGAVQPPVNPAIPAAPPVNPGIPAAPAATIPAPAAPAAPADATAAVQPPAAPPAAVAEVKPPEPPPVLPTSGDGATIITLLSKVCKPVVAGGNFEQLVKAAGMTKDRKTLEWVTPLAQKPFQVAISQPGENNKNVCQMKVRYAPGWDQPIIDAMNVWRFLHEPQLRLARNDIGKYKDAQRTTTTWDNWENQSFDGKMIGLILVQLNKPDGSAIDPKFDEALVQYSERAALPNPAPVAAQPTTSATPAS